MTSIISDKRPSAELTHVDMSRGCGVRLALGTISMHAASGLVVTGPPSPSVSAAAGSPWATALLPPSLSPQPPAVITSSATKETTAKQPVVELTIRLLHPVFW
jgi:hypothetical protein